METKDLEFIRQLSINMLVSSLTNFVFEHGEDMCDYYREEHGIDDEDVVSVLDLTCKGGLAFHLPWPYEEEDYCYFSSFWSLYIIRTESYSGFELKYYRFINDGMEFDEEESQPDHGYAIDLSLAELEYIYTFLMEAYKKSKGG